MTATAGYSGKPLYQKLGLKEGHRVSVVGYEADYKNLIPGAPQLRLQQRQKLESLKQPQDVVHIFCAHKADLDTHFPAAFAKVAEGGMVWVSWPKKSSKKFIDLTEDGIRSKILADGEWVDVKVCAVDQDWSGLKFLRRRR